MARRRSVRNLWASLGVVGLAFTAVAHGAVTASAADPTDAEAASANSVWLASQLDGGTFPNPMNPALPDYGLMIDALLAMYASGNGTLAKPTVDRMDAQKEARGYFTYFGFGEGQDWLQNEGLDDRIGGATAKVLVAAEAAGRNPRSFGGYDMVSETQRSSSRLWT